MSPAAENLRGPRRQQTSDRAGSQRFPRAWIRRPCGYRRRVAETIRRFGKDSWRWPSLKGTNCYRLETLAGNLPIVICCSLASRAWIKLMTAVTSSNALE